MYRACAVLIEDKTLLSHILPETRQWVSGNIH
jgi:hypothetical protein